MKRLHIVLGSLASVAILAAGVSMLSGQDKSPAPKVPSAPVYQYPEFYKGIYLTSPSGKNIEKLKSFIILAKKSGINTMVIDVQPSPTGGCVIPKENVDLMLENDIHPIARVVCFDDGLKTFPVPESVLQNKLNYAKSSAEAGFKEIQFDYIRFNDFGMLARIPLQKKYEFIEGFLARAKAELKPYNVKVAADIFGRIPLNTGDSIGQRIEGLDRVIDVICPMAYPSHYTWSEKMMSDPYYTVFTTSVRARERSKQADIVSYIQAFKIKVSKSGLTYEEYVRQQVKAVHDAKIRGYIFWNAAQDYAVPFKVAEEFYKSAIHQQTKSETKKGSGVAL